MYGAVVVAWVLAASISDCVSLQRESNFRSRTSKWHVPHVGLLCRESVMRAPAHARHSCASAGLHSLPYGGPSRRLVALPRVRCLSGPGQYCCRLAVYGCWCSRPLSSGGESRGGAAHAVLHAVCWVPHQQIVTAARRGLGAVD